MKNKKLFWVFTLSSAVYFTQGIENLPSQGLFYYLKETLHFSPQKIMVITTITMLTWLVKPLIGYLIDNFFNKKVWIFIALSFDILLVYAIGFYWMPVFMLVTFLLLNSTNAAFRDVAVDGIMCVEGKKYKATGKIQSVQWVALYISQLITGIGGGYLAEKWDYRAAFLCLIPVYILVGVTAFFYKEEDSPAGKIPAHIFQELKKLFSDKRLLLIGLFIFLYRFSPSFGTPLFFIQRDVFKWSKIWIGALGTISTVFAIAGALLYYKFSSKIDIKKWLFISVFFGAFTSLCYLYYTPVAAVIYEIIFSLITMFIFLMLLDFMARNTTSGFEATSFAFLASMSNLALAAGNLSGAFLLPVVGLKWLIIISAIASFLCLPLIGKLWKQPQNI